MRKPPDNPSGEAGMALIEILVSALLLLVVAAGVFTAFDVGTRATAQERNRARANSLAEADLERMRSMRIADLATLNETRNVTLDGIVFTVTSTSQFVNEPATTSTCATGTGSRDYLRITSSVTWPGIGSRPPVTASSIVSPPSGSVVPNSGSLLVSVFDSRAAGLAGVTLSGTGPGSFSGTTNSAGCVLWRNLPAGNYTMTVGGTAAGKVDPDGDPPNTPTAETVSVVAGGTNTKTLEFDTPGALAVSFVTEPYGNGNPIGSSADAIRVFATGSNLATDYATNPPGTREPTIASPPELYPFISNYTVYAGTCSDNNPDPTGAGANQSAFAFPIVPPGGTTSPVPSIKLPALHLTVRTGRRSNQSGSPIAGARVRVTDDNCGVTRTLATNASFQLALSPTGPTDPGLPYGDDYTVCADAYFGGIQRRNYVNISDNSSTRKNVALTNPDAGAVETIYLATNASGVATSTTQGAPSASCP